MKNSYLSIAFVAIGVMTSAVCLGQTKACLPTLKVEEKGSHHRISSISEIAGEYNLSSFWQFWNDERGEHTIKINIRVINELTGQVEINNIVDSRFVYTPVTAYVDVSAGTLSIPNDQDLGIDVGYDHAYFYIKKMDSDGNIIPGIATDIASSVGVIEDGVITFPADQVWAIGNYYDDSSWWYYANNNVIYDPNAGLLPVDDNDWEPFTSAVFEDGWYVTGFTSNGEPVKASDYPWTVEVERNKETPTLIRIKNPYFCDNTPNFIKGSSKEGNIIIDMTDKDFITVVPNVFSGYYENSMAYCNNNMEGFYMSLGMSKEEVIEELSPINVFGTVSDDGKTIVIPNCGFNYPGSFTKIYTWSTPEGVSLADNMVTKLILEKSTSDVVDFEDEAQEAIEEYYTLQGIRINKQEQGQIVIVRRGAETTKKVAR